MIAQHTRPPKYGNHRVQHGYHWHDSARELRHCETLALLKRAGEIRSYAVHPRYPLHGLDMSTICAFIPDFVVEDAQGLHVEDIKGHIDKRSPAWNLFQVKSRLLEAEYGIPVRVVT